MLVGAIVDGITAAGNAKHAKKLEEAQRQQSKVELSKLQAPEADPMLDLAINVTLFSILLGFIIFIIQQTRQ